MRHHPRTIVNLSKFAGLIAVGLLLAACGDSGGGSDPAPPADPTATVPVATSPAVISTIPTNGATKVSVKTEIKVTFSAAELDVASVTKTSVRLMWLVGTPRGPTMPTAT